MRLKVSKGEGKESSGLKKVEDILFLKSTETFRVYSIKWNKKNLIEGIFVIKLINFV